MAKQITLILTDEEYEILVEELRSLFHYHWLDDHIHADDCGSKVLGVVESRAEDLEEESDRCQHCKSILLSARDGGKFECGSTRDRQSSDCAKIVRLFEAFEQWKGK